MTADDLRSAASEAEMFRLIAPLTAEETKEVAQLVEPAAMKAWVDKGRPEVELTWDNCVSEIESRPGGKMRGSAQEATLVTHRSGIGARALRLKWTRQRRHVACRNIAMAALMPSCTSEITTPRGPRRTRGGAVRAIRVIRPPGSSQTRDPSLLIATIRNTDRRERYNGV
jgi:hypothetical protein